MSTSSYYFLSVYYMPGFVLSMLHVVTSWNSQYSPNCYFPEPGFSALPRALPIGEAEGKHSRAGVEAAGRLEMETQKAEGKDVGCNSRDGEGPC